MNIGRPFYYLALDVVALKRVGNLITFNILMTTACQSMFCWETFQFLHAMNAYLNYDNFARTSSAIDVPKCCEKYKKRGINRALQVSCEMFDDLCFRGNAYKQTKSININKTRRLCTGKQTHTHIHSQISEFAVKCVLFL